MDELLRVEHLRKTFTLSRKQQRTLHLDSHHIVAVNDLSFTANRGEIFGLLGPNGAGKTTTLRMLATLLSPDSGDALLDGCSVVRQPEAVRARIGFLTSELKLEEFFTPRYLFDFFGRLHGVAPADIASRRADLFQRFGIDRFADTRIANLSTGMKQKTSLVISLVHNPDVIVFDEPTNGLDVITARSVTDFLLELRSQGKTVILSTHIFSLVERLCNRVGIIIDGSMVACGQPDELRGTTTLEDYFFDLYTQQKGATT
ncbi:MAG: ABC transporter ATP-binding protein [Bacteroidales bacterium]|nr:ABC transporter ATP-binding protein [Bacteroidales bacterium]